MTVVGDHGLSCLDDSNYAAIALSMQANALAINAAIKTDQAAMTAYGNRYVRRFVSTSVASGGANSGTTLPDGTGAIQVVLGNLGVLPQGWYAASGSQTYQEAGAVTAGSYRRSVLLINQGLTQFPPTLFQATTSATNTASADSMTVNGWFYSDAITLTQVRLMFGHGNTGSSMNVAIGAVLTVRFLSTGLVT